MDYYVDPDLLWSLSFLLLIWANVREKRLREPKPVLPREEMNEIMKSILTRSNE